MNISGNIDSLAAYASSLANQAKRNGPTPFRVVMNDAVAPPSAPAQSDPAAVQEKKLISDLNNALQAAGISVPPSIQIVQKDGKYVLDGDNRNDKFQAMMESNPDLASRLGTMVQNASSGRHEALDEVLYDFMGKNSSVPGMERFLKDFMESEDHAQFSLNFNGNDLAVNEKGEDGWRAVKGKSDFTKELLDAYVKFQLHYGVSVEKQDDRELSDADIAFRRDLEKEIQNFKKSA